MCRNLYRLSIGDNANIEFQNSKGGYRGSKVFSDNMNMCSFL